MKYKFICIILFILIIVITSSNSLGYNYDYCNNELYKSDNEITHIIIFFIGTIYNVTYNNYVNHSVEQYTFNCLNTIRIYWFQNKFFTIKYLRNGESCSLTRLYNQPEDPKNIIEFYGFINERFICAIQYERLEF